MSTVPDLPTQASPLVGEERFLISDIRWDFYVAFCEEIGERPLRLTYSDGMLEIMITKAPHEFCKKMLAKLIEILILELDLPVRSGGSMTFQRKGSDVQNSILPDMGLPHGGRVARQN